MTPSAQKKTSPKDKQSVAEAFSLEPPDFVQLRAAELRPWLPFLYGNRFARVAAIKGECGAAESAGNPPFFGPDAVALENALEVLGWGSNSWCGIMLERSDTEALSAADLRMVVEIIDPVALLALDRQALQVLQKSFEKTLLPHFPKAGLKTRLGGRALVFVDGFEAALASEPQDGGEAKHRVWRELRALKN